MECSLLEEEVSELGAVSVSVGVHADRRFSWGAVQDSSLQAARSASALGQRSCCLPLL